MKRGLEASADTLFSACSLVIASSSQQQQHALSRKACLTIIN